MGDTAHPEYVINEPQLDSLLEKTDQDQPEEDV